MYNFFLIYKVFHIFVGIFLRKFMKKHIGLSAIFLIFSLCPIISLSQTEKNDETKADRLHGKYEFGQAASLYKKELEKCTDSLKRIVLEKKLIQSENGMSLLEFAFEPIVEAAKQYPRKGFFLHYPGFEQGSWVKLPQQLAPEKDLSTGEFPVMQYSSSSDKMIFSAPDENGSWNLYTSTLLGDTLWSVPALLNENITSSGNEIFPVISPSGKNLYFSSNGHYGVGGYDLYMCEWDPETKDWGMPQNMGFPYSSPEDDLFFYNTPDGFHSVFASNRNCEKESVVIYILEYENVPLKKSVTPAEAARISKLELSGKKSKDNSVAAVDKGAENSEFSEYTLAVNKVRKLQQQLVEAFNRQAQNRELYNMLNNGDDLRLLEQKIAEQETATMALQNEINEAMLELQKLEVMFLAKGMFVPEVEMVQEPVEAEPDNKEKIVPAFADMVLNEAPQLNVLKPEPEIDLAFKILDEAQIVGMEELPQGLVYQIQLFAVSKKASLKSLKGLSPVFERKYPSGKYIYSVGAFRKYDEALSNLGKVKKRGFSSAIITAYKDGKSMNLKSARTLEKELANSGVYQVCIEGYDTLPQEVLSVIRGITEKDIAKTANGGNVRYVIGPFGNEEDAKILVTGLRAVSDKVIEVEKVK